MTLRIVLGNNSRSLLSALGELSHHLQCALESVDQQVHVSFAELDIGTTAIVIEGFSEDESLNALRSFRRAGGRFGIVCTEQVSEDGFNLVNGKMLPYDYPRFLFEEERDSAEAATARFQRFRSIAPDSQFIWCLEASAVDAVRTLAGHDRVFHLPFGHLSNLDAIPLLPLAQRTYDFAVLSRLTDYRRTVVDDLRSRGFSVFMPEYVLPDYLKRDIVARTRIVLGIRSEAGRDFLPSQPIAHNLNMGVFQLVETASLGPLSRFLTSVEGGSLVEACAQALASRPFYETQMRAFGDFKKEMPMHPIMTALLQASLG